MNTINIKKILKLDNITIKELDTSIKQMELKGFITMEDFVYHLGSCLPMSLTILSKIIKKPVKETIDKIKKKQIPSDILKQVLDDYEKHLLKNI